MTLGLFGGISLVGCAVLVWWATAAAAAGRLPRNGGVGIRTTHTSASDGAWVAGHEAALAPAKVVAIVSALLGVAMAVAAVVEGSAEPGALVVVLFVLGYLAMLVGAIVVARVADRAARDADA